jgi:ABC-type multidrug transport system fused ATPase/permease subunit
VVRLGDAARLTDVRHVPLPDLRQRVGMVTQNVQIFHASVRDNLTLFDHTIRDEDILQVIHGLELSE